MRYLYELMVYITKTILNWRLLIFIDRSSNFTTPFIHKSIHNSNRIYISTVLSSWWGRHHTCEQLQTCPQYLTSKPDPVSVTPAVSNWTRLNYFWIWNIKSRKLIEDPENFEDSVLCKCWWSSRFLKLIKNHQISQIFPSILYLPEILWATIPCIV